ncbi:MULTISPECIES: 1,4-dihydroxy-2-naphthoyl-CoA hydrolase [Proteus]|jgi:1,4-dihydroxy-2-naphthoyl-CoA hydrolase|uniref:1,4-dihydroxy-2-naphthoyl-CoA hydrolase n=1 Tax=Proteus vulgaris TaxID=585 RepID=A0A6G6SLB9_PROVU|nr:MULTISPECIES: 1,4-dihydroxy-2-naphthoyl-CoA hydrolase [Proteus]MBG3078913.1 1,4-dihydroxy-2-naphthoyl-CoA hydrolase [Proteus mirabilis]ATN00746.1 esterase [Proteus vulgaris]MBG2838091.1 1,4-dihydroxy-2-naphthoyl-CoA hydrolase [Proteus terrae subsp. cibarius]MBG2869278.1 1,4-dihydroxy-2-naphthoyl-CoA hydrolase [Proteus terrae subsp. cibarius]MBJ2108198.1 1,4-dihydroxy-2-naphthoyl-CoA hydrolase [Proteus terrae]
MIWKRETTIEHLNHIGQNNMMSHLGIELTCLGDDYLEGTMPVDHRTKQPLGLLHGGASVVLAETLGSVAGYLCTEGEQKIVGLEINANHIRSAREGKVRGVCKPIHLGRSHQVWSIEIFDDEDRQVCISRLTTSVIS